MSKTKTYHITYEWTNGVNTYQSTMDHFLNEPVLAIARKRCRDAAAEHCRLAGRQFVRVVSVVPRLH